MPRISRIEFYNVTIPLKDPFYPAWIPGYPQTDSRFTLLELATDDGVTGWAAGNAFADERSGLGSLLGPYLIGLDATDIPRARQLLREASFLGWHNFWIEAAFWDIKGKIEGKPVYQLLNPELSEPVTRAKVYASSGSIRPASDRLRYIDRIREMGFDAVKLRVHDFEMKDDLAIVEAVRRHVGDDFTIGVDANQGWRVTLIKDAPLWDLERASAFAKACEEFDVAWLEEPLDMHAYDELAELRRITKTKIAGCELNIGWQEAKIMLEKGSLDIYQPDALFCGGLTASKQIYEACLERGLDFTPHTWTNGVGFIVNLHAFAAYPERKILEYPFEPPGWIPEVRDAILEEPIAVAADGTIAIPQEPGLGLKIDRKKLKRYGTRFYKGTKGRIAMRTIREKGLRTTLEIGRGRKAGDKARRLE
jgi:L-alanine-DL-glutamate epimerase-like enolase superfamily enzyme